MSTNLGGDRSREPAEPAEPAGPAEPALPSGRQFEIGRDGTTAVVTEVGATLRQLEIGGRPCLDAFGAGDMPDAGRGQVLMPFPNRVAGGRYRWAGEELQLPVNELPLGNAAHGLVRWSAWQVRRRAADAIRLGITLHPQDGYPFTLDLTLTYTVERAGLTVRHTAHNCGRAAAPFGAGFHPYLTAGTRTVDSNLLRLPAASYFEADDRLIPTGRADVAGTPFDFREPRPIGNLRLDTGFGDLERDGDGWATIALAAPDGGRCVRLLLGPGYDYFQLFTGDPLPEPRRRTGLAVEPYTCAPDAFNNGLGLIKLEPGHQTAGAWGISVS